MRTRSYLENKMTIHCFFMNFYMFFAQKEIFDDELVIPAWFFGCILRYAIFCIRDSHFHWPRILRRLGVGGKFFFGKEASVSIGHISSPVWWLEMPLEKVKAGKPEKMCDFFAIFCLPSMCFVVFEPLKIKLVPNFFFAKDSWVSRETNEYRMMQNTWTLVG